MRAAHTVALVAGLALVAALAAPVPAQAFQWPFGRSAAAAAADGPPRPVVTEILADAGQDSRSVPGVIEAATQVTLAFRTLGRLVARDVAVGDVVAKGDLLARQETEDLTGNIRAAEAGVEAAQVQLSTAQSTARRTRELVRRKVASEAQLEQAEQALAAATAAAEQAQSELLRAQDAATFAEIAAPFDGVISAVYEDPGAVVAAGAPVVQLSAQDRRSAVIDLPEAVATALPHDAAFTVWQESAPEVLTAARIDRIEPVADSATRTRRVHLALDQGEGFRLGALIRARLEGGPVTALTLPEQALIRDGAAVRVWVVDRSAAAARGVSQDATAPDAGARLGTVRLAEIEVQPAINGRVLVAAGLKPGDEVVTRGVHSLTEGQTVGAGVAP